MTTTETLTVRMRFITILATASLLALSGCGGGNNTPAAAASTTLSGAVVKGPVDGAEVCAFALAGNAKGAAVGTCVKTDANGNYTLSLPVGSGPLWLQATDGKYIDEATNAITSLPAGVPLSTLITANGGTVNAMLTPLTTLALNAALANMGSSGTLDAASFSNAVMQVMTALGLTGFDINGTLPALGTNINDYGRALTAISQMVANGTQLATILKSNNPSTLAADYKKAAQATGGSGNSGGGGGSSTSVSTASGTLKLTGDNAAVAAWGDFTPGATGFEVKLSTGSDSYSSNLSDTSRVSYVFHKTVQDTNGQPVRVEIEVSKSGKAFSPIGVSYTYGNSKKVSGSGGYVGAGTVSISTPAGATHPVTIQFDKFKPSFDLTLDGTLIGDATGALWSVSELPGTTSDNATIGGVPFAPSDAVVNGQGDSALFLLGDGRSLQLVGNTANYTNNVVYSCFSNCGISSVANNAVGTTFSFANSQLNAPNNGGVRALSGSITIGKTSGNLAFTSTNAAGLGTFTPQGSTVNSNNDRLDIVFKGAGNERVAAIETLTISRSNGAVQGVLVKLNGLGSGQTYGCGTPSDSVGGITFPACDGVTLDSSGLGVTFSNASLGGSVIAGGVLPTQVLNGTVNAKGR